APSAEGQADPNSPIGPRPLFYSEGESPPARPVTPETGMNLNRRILSLFALVLLSLPPPALAHPGSGIVVDDRGQVFFQDTLGRTIWKIDAEGKLTEFHLGIGGHWMCLDAGGSFARAQPKFYFGRITPTG